MIVNKEKEYMGKEFWYEHWNTILQNIFVQIYAIINNCNEWFWQDGTIWGYMFPEMIIRDVGFINSHVAWQPIILLERWPQEICADTVTNEHLVKCIKAYLTVIWVAKHQNGMETRQCKYCFLISLLLRRIRAKKYVQISTCDGYGIPDACTINYTVVYFSKTKGNHTEIRKNIR